MSATGTWLCPPPPGGSAAALQMVALPCAGASHALYSAWLADAPPGLEIRPVRMPGRGGPGPAPASAEEFGVVLAEEIAAEPAPSAPLVVFGHSFGGLVAYAAARRLCELGRPPGLLVVAGAASGPPEPGDDVASATDAELVDYLRAMGGTPPEILEDENFVAFLIAQLRRDLSLGQAFRFAERVALPVPLWAVAGTEDPVAGADRMRTWTGFGDATSELIGYPGGHFAVHGPAVRRTLMDRIAAVAARL